MRFFIAVISSVLISSSLLAQYTIISPYLQHPSKAIGFVDSCAQFWINTYDTVHGGFYTNIDKSGNVIFNQKKTMHTQTRNIYAMVRAYMLTADSTYLDYARDALNFMYQHAWDVTSGGWLNDLDEEGNALSPRADKTCYYQHYALLGIAAYYECTRDTLAWNWLIKGVENMENHFWDSRPAYLGYYDLVDYDLSNARDKSFNATVDAITTHMLHLYLMTADIQYLDRLRQLADQINFRLVASMSSQVIGFVEKYDSDWNWNQNETMTIMGHVLKTGWCLARIQQLAPDPFQLSGAQICVNHVLQNGYDHQYGGPYKDFNRLTGELLLWGSPDTTKAWWQLEQALTSGLMLYDLTNDTTYLHMADQSVDFAMRYFVDRNYGEVYAERTRYGDLAWNEYKGGEWKAGYHSTELGYYLYLYGNLFIHQQPVILHYRFDPLPFERDILLTPLAINDDALQILQVQRDEQAYTNYDPISRELHLPANTGGHFAVTFGQQPKPIFAHRTGMYPQQVYLDQNYPNPFNSRTAIGYQLSAHSHVELVVYNALGQKIAILVNQMQPAGHYRVEWNAEGFASGVYVYQLRTDSGFIDSKKLILLK